MSKTWETKNRILDLLYEGNKTLSDMSGELGLTLATVKQHLGELEAMGAIVRVDNPHVKKWKYYAINPDFGSGRKPAAEPPVLQKYPRIFIGIAAMLLAVGLFYAVMLHGNTGAAGQAGQLGANGTVLMSVSDSPLANASYVQMSAINLTISNITVRSAADSRLYTVLDTPRQFNLLQLRNISELIANASLPNGAYDLMIIHIESANVTVGNSTERLFIPTNTIEIDYGFNVTPNATSLVNVDFNLFKSIRTTANGSVVMLPVINVTDRSGVALALGSGGIISSIRNGKLAGEGTYGMDDSGIMRANASAQQGGQLDIGANGALVPGAAGSRGSDIELIDNRTLTVIWQANLTANGTAPVAVVVPGNGLVRKSYTVMCRPSDNTYECDAHTESLGINASVALGVASQISESGSGRGGGEGASGAHGAANATTSAGDTGTQTTSSSSNEDLNVTVPQVTSVLITPNASIGITSNVSIGGSGELT